MCRIKIYAIPRPLLSTTNSLPLLLLPAQRLAIPVWVLSPPNVLPASMAGIDICVMVVAYVSLVFTKQAFLPAKTVRYQSRVVIHVGILLTARVVFLDALHWDLTLYTVIVL